MKNKHLKFKEIYFKPTCTQIECNVEGFLCQSPDGNAGKNESYDSWNNYEHDGWN